MKMNQSKNNVINLRRKLSKLFPLAICLVFALFLLPGCSGPAASDAEENTRSPITIWTWDETFNVKAAKLAVAEYTALNPETEFDIVTKEREEILVDVKNILAAKLYARLPDVIMIEDYDIQAVLSLYEDEFVTLNDRVDYERFADYKTNLCSRNDRMYGIPFDSGTAALFYRTDILRDAGFGAEDMENLTWDRFIEIGRTVLEKTGKPMLTLDPTDLPLVRIIMQSCGKWYVSPDGEHADIESNDALKNAMEVYLNLLETGVGKSVNGWNEFISAFQNGDVASVISGGWIISSIKVSDDQKGLWRVTNIPICPDVNAVAASNVGGSAWYVLKNSASSKAATDFVVSMFASNDAFMDNLIKEIGIIPALKDITAYRHYSAGDPFFSGQKVTSFLTDLEADIPTVNYGSKTYEIEDILEEELQKTMSDKDIGMCLKRVQLKSDALIINKKIE